MWLKAKTKDRPSIINTDHMVSFYPSLDETFSLARDARGEQHTIPDLTFAGLKKKLDAQ